MSKLEFKMFVDCGAPSLYNQLARKFKTKGVMGATFAQRKFDSHEYVKTEQYQKYKQAYIDFLKSEDAQALDVYSNLDVINSPELTWANQKELESAGLNPIPVYHVGTDPKWLKRIVEKYDYIAIGGMIPNTSKVLVPILDNLWKTYILDKDGFPKVKVHGFAATGFPLMNRYPWYSVDSTTCGKLGMYGEIAIFVHDRHDRLINLPVSARDVPLKVRYTPLVLKELEQRAKEFGYTLQELSETFMYRATFNHLSFSKWIRDNVPMWPWSFTTKQSKKGAEHHLDFYFANQLSEKAELYFLEYLQQFDWVSRTRLMSFYYRKRLLEVLKLKNKNQ